MGMQQRERECVAEFARSVNEAQDLEYYLCGYRLQFAPLFHPESQEGKDALDEAEQDLADDVTRGDRVAYRELVKSDPALVISILEGKASWAPQSVDLSSSDC